MARVVEIYSKNDRFQLIEACLRNRNKRHKQGLFAVEAVKAVNLALESGFPVHAAVCARERKLSAWAQDVLARVPLVYRLPEALFCELSDREEPSELFLLCGMRFESIFDVPIKNGLIVLLDRPQNPGNLGSILRSADAMGADCVVLSGHSADEYDPQCVRASLGTVLTLPVCHLQGLADLELLRERRPELRFVGTSAHGDKDIDALDLRNPLVLLLGNETEGLSRALKERCDELVRIPISGAASSLNLACAASICLYEVQRQRLHTSF